jgi:enoyl-CoA hydratase
MAKYPFFEVEKFEKDNTAFLYLNFPARNNSMNWDFWRDLPEQVRELEEDPSIRCVVVAGKGESFSIGLDLSLLAGRLKSFIQGDIGDTRQEFLEIIFKMQSGMNAISNGSKIYIAAVNSLCIGAGLDLISACDLRLCSKDAVFAIKQTRVGIVADMGCLNRLPRIIGEGHTRMMALTGRNVKAGEAYRIGLVNEVYETKQELLEHALQTANEIAANPGITVRGVKKILNYGLNHGLRDCLNNVCLWNAAFLDSRDLREMQNALANKKRPKFNQHKKFEAGDAQ